MLLSLRAQRGNLLAIARRAGDCRVGLLLAVTDTDRSPALSTFTRLPCGIIYGDRLRQTPGALRLAPQVAYTSPSHRFAFHSSDTPHAHPIRPRPPAAVHRHR